MQARPEIHVVVVEDDPSERKLLQMLLEEAGFQVTVFCSGEDARTALQAGMDASVLVTDLELPGISGLDLLKHIRENRPALPSIVLTGHGSVRAAIATLETGAHDFLLKPLAPPDILPLTIQRAVARAKLGARNAYLESLLDPQKQDDGLLVGTSPPMRRVKEQIHAIAPTTTTTLIEGETGTGKELVARSLHLHSPRSTEPFISVNCGALSSSLLESELFGYERGAFTGAVGSHAGLFEAATAGTLFLDEVGSMSAAMQAALLRILQEREVRRLGSTTTRCINTRVIAATNKPLSSLVDAGTFRADLMYRLDVANIKVPPLRERPGDIPALMKRFLRIHAAQNGRRPPTLGPRCLARLQEHHWPGNVRELSNCAARLLLLIPPTVTMLQDLPERLIRSTAPPPPIMSHSNSVLSLKAARADFDRRYVSDALARNANSLSRTARELELDPSNLRRLMRRLGLKS